jgi:hypothetical protein
LRESDPYGFKKRESEVFEQSGRYHRFERTFKLKRSKSTGKPVNFLQLTNLKSDPCEWEKLRSFLKVNNQEIGKLVQNGTAPLFEYPPLLFSPHSKIPIKELSDEDRYPFLKVLIKHVFLKNEGRLSVKEIKHAMSYLIKQ